MSTAFKQLSNIFKYKSAGKDGSIVNHIRIGDNIESDPNKINKLLIDVLRKLQFDESKEISDPLPFPHLDDLTPCEAEFIVNKMASNKALSFDLVSDIIFSQNYKLKTSEIIKSLWNDRVTNSLDLSHFEARLVPLNKKHPDIPRPEEFRPIIVMSPLIKLLEARLLPRLQTYLIMCSQRSQVGFVPGMDIFVNIFRALKQLRRRTSDKKRAFCLFLDFKSAYNSIPHDALFQKLESICPNSEVQLLKAIYSRLTIKIGDEKTKCNIGVAQGSMISPALFDIYSEELISRLIDAGFSFEDILAYADDHLIICDSLEDVLKAISVVKTWCSSANISLNPQKSGILEVIPRRSKPTLKTGTLVCDIPVVASYKYLGLEIDCKLTGDKHLSFLISKINFITNRLAPLLSKVSTNYKINLWKTLIQPLLNLALPLLAHNNWTRVQKMERNLKCCFKRFIGLCLSTDDQVLSKLINLRVLSLAKDLERSSLSKWQQRLSHCPDIVTQKKEKIPTPLIPKIFTKYNNFQKSKCRLCNNNSINSAFHLRNMHGLSIPSPLQLLCELERDFPRKSKSNPRAYILKEKENRILQYFNILLRHSL